MSSKTIVIKTRDIHPIQAALTALDGRQEPCEITSQDGKVTHAINTVPYKFTGAARLRIAKWLAAINPVADAIKKAHEALVREHSSPEDRNRVAPGNVETYREKFEATMNEDHSFELEQIKLEDLKIEDNKLSPSALAILFPLIAE